VLLGVAGENLSWQKADFDTEASQGTDPSEFLSEVRAFGFELTELQVLRRGLRCGLTHIAEEGRNFPHRIEGFRVVLQWPVFAGVLGYG